MGLTAKDPGGSDDFQPVPYGVSQAICCAVVDLGTQLNPLFNKEAYKVLIMWEFPEHRIQIQKDGELEKEMPMVISRMYRLSLHVKSDLRKDLEAWRQRPFDEKELEGFNLSKLLGVNANIQVVHVKKQVSGKEKVYANVSAIMGLMKNQTKLDLEHEEIMYEIDSGEPLPDLLPDWIGNIIRLSPEYRKLHSDDGQYPGAQNSSQGEPAPSGTGGPLYDDDIPF